MNGVQLTYENGLLAPVVRNGSLAVGDILRQNQAVILMLHKGDMKENPAVGVGISDMLLDNDPLMWRNMIREQLEMDGQRVKSVKITQKGIVIESEY